MTISKPVRQALVLLFLLGMSMPSALIPNPAAGQAEVPDIAVSTPLLADIVRNVAGEGANVFSIMPEHADPHTWEATPRDIERVKDAESFISIGAHLEPFVESGGWRRAVIDGGVPQLILAEHVDLIEVDKVIDHGDHVHDLREGDPHIWLDPNKVIEAIPAIADHLATISPGHAATWSANAEAYITTLRELDAELEASFAAIPAENRKLAVFHDAYTYFAARYDFEVVGVVLKNPGAELSARDLADLESVVDEHGITVIFVEPQYPTEMLELFIAEHDLEIGELLTDAFAGKVGSYVDLMRFNRDSLVTHLAAG